ncbi:hypothetical protein AAIB41_11560 [Brucella sp. BE17]|uniref:hypothetical protein n=1 Tax=Brucella sp. BE17 TaxID=3142977 RepID=UPI0031BB2E02
MLQLDPFGFIIALAWLAIAAIMSVIPASRAKGGCHARRAAIAVLISVAAFSFARTQVYRDLGFSSWNDMIESFRADDPTR